MKAQKEGRSVKVWVVCLGVLLFIGGIAGCSTEKSVVSTPYTSMVGPGPDLWACKAPLVPLVRQARVWSALAAKRVFPGPPVSKAQSAQEARQEMLQSEPPA